MRPARPSSGGFFELLRGERLAILGENGTGKTTLLKTLAGRLPALAGTVTHGHDVSIGYYDQELRDLDPKGRAIDAVWDQHPDESEDSSVRTWRGSRSAATTSSRRSWVCRGARRAA